MSTTATRIRQIAEQNAALQGALLPILQEIQAIFGYLPPATVPVVAKMLNLSRAEVHGVISFYHLLRTTPPGRQTLYLCRAEACQSMGGAALADQVREKLGLNWHETSTDGWLSLEPIYCLGNCACAPAAMLDDRLLGRVEFEQLQRLIEPAKSN